MSCIPAIFHEEQFTNGEFQSYKNIHLIDPLRMNKKKMNEKKKKEKNKFSSTK